MAKSVGTFARTLVVAVVAMLAQWAVTAQASDFLRSALIAAGAADAGETAKWEAAYETQQRDVLANGVLCLPLSEQLTAIQQGLHERLLTGEYRPAASDLRVVLESGDFNCLSATALCFDLCRAAGIELEIWTRPGHVWLQTTDGDIVEAVRQPSLALQASRTATTPGRRLTPVELLGKFYYNRGVQLLQQKRYAEGLKLMHQAAALDPRDADARENLLAGLNNWAAEHLQAGRYSEAARLIRQGLAIEPEYGPLVANLRLLPAPSGR